MYVLPAQSCMNILQVDAKGLGYIAGSNIIVVQNHSLLSATSYIPAPVSP